jgi:hypothetical protein
LVSAVTVMEPDAFGVFAENCVSSPKFFCIMYVCRAFPNPPHTVYRTMSSALRVTFTGVLATTLHTSQMHWSARLRPTVYSCTLRSTPYSRRKD